MADRKKIESGQRYNRLTVLRKTDKRLSGHVVWECRCDCGNVACVTSTRLKSGETKSCGCAGAHANLMDISGQRFGRLVALEATEKRLGNSVIWKCQCDCGKAAEVAAINLRNGNTKSCGCLSSEAHADAMAAFTRPVRSPDYVCGTDVRQLIKAPQSNNSSGVTGVSWDNSVKTWKAEIRFRGRRYYLGSSRDKTVAIGYRKAAEQRIHGEFLEWYYKTYPERKKEALEVAEKTCNVTIRLSPELKEQLQRAAEAENRTVSNFLESLIKQALNK